MQKVNILENIVSGVERMNLRLYLEFKNNVQVKLDDVRVIDV